MYEMLLIHHGKVTILLSIDSACQADSLKDVAASGAVPGKACS
jgi:hypothetical protein